MVSENARGRSYLIIKEKIKEIAKKCGRDSNEIKLVVVTKNCPIEAIQEVYKCGARDFGENRVQDVLEKISLLPQDIQWHFIGSLQNNKVNKVVGKFALIHSVDSLHLAKKINEESEKIGVITSILLQVNTSGEGTKHGLDEDGWRAVLDDVNKLNHVKVKGLMTMAPFTEDEEIIRSCFRKLRNFQDEMKQYVREPDIFEDLSMGMSNDYKIAIEEGATILRIGSAIMSTDSCE